MSVTSQQISSDLGLEISAGQRPTRRSQARPAPGHVWSTPFRRFGALARVILNAATRPRPRVLTLDLPEYTVSFQGPAEFEFALSSRIEFPARKLSSLMHRPIDDLQIMASNIRQVEKRFAEALAQSLHEPGLISDLLQEIELKLFSKDHQWRDIAEALNHLSPAYDVYKRIALVKYLQYLGCRQDVLRNIYLDKLRDPDLTAAGDEAVAPDARPEHAGVPVSLVGSETTAEPDLDTQAIMARDTAIFHVEQIHLEGDAEGFAFLPRGETVDIEVRPGETVEIALSNYRLKLYPGQRFRVTDEEGAIHILGAGKSIIGRHSGADIVVTSENRTISRKHLMIEPVSPTRVKLTDLSSHGTSLPVHFVNSLQ